MPIFSEPTVASPVTPNVPPTVASPSAFNVAPLNANDPLVTAVDTVAPVTRSASLFPPTVPVPNLFAHVAGVVTFEPSLSALVPNAVYTAPPVTRPVLFSATLPTLTLIPLASTDIVLSAFLTENSVPVNCKPFPAV